MHHVMMMYGAHVIFTMYALPGTQDLRRFLIDLSGLTYTAAVPGRAWIGWTRQSRINVPRVDYEKLSGDRMGEPSECIRARVQAARDIQQARFTNSEYRTSNNGSSTDIICNADMRVGEIRQYCKLPEEGQTLMRAAMSQLNLSAQAYHRTLRLKLARPIADLAGCEEIQSVHLAEALQYRPRLMLN